MTSDELIEALVVSVNRFEIIHIPHDYAAGAPWMVQRQHRKNARSLTGRGATLHDALIDLYEQVAEKGWVTP